jgi:hypothetical protein
MGSDPLIRRLIQSRVAQGQLPRKGRVMELRITLGNGTVCDGCGAVIAKDHTRASAIMVDTWQRVQLHIRCYNVWNVERNR